MLQGAIMPMQQCQFNDAPKILQGGHRRNAEMLGGNRPPIFTGVTKAPRIAPSALRLRGATSTPQQCLDGSAPTSFIWCRLRIAAMPLEQRTKGRAMWGAQKCQLPRALPTQFNGVIVKTQKCLDIVAPRGEPSSLRRDASIVPLCPTSLSGH